MRRIPDDWEPAVYTRFAVEPITPAIGAELTGIDLREPLDGASQRELHRALLEWKVLVFRDQRLSASQQVAFAENWGPLWDDQLVPTPDRNPLEMLVEFTRDGETRGMENEWHADGTFRVCPTLGTVLRAVEVPGVGGDTLFADMAAAYDNLPEVVRREIDDLVAEHDWVDSYGSKYAAQKEELRRLLPPVQHPVVRTHPETGRRTLFVNRYFTKRVLGLPAAQSDELIEYLAGQADVPEYQCRVRWRCDTVVFWDNRAVQHFACSDYWPARRIMARATITGDRPY